MLITSNGPKYNKVKFDFFPFGRTVHRVEFHFPDQGSILGPLHWELKSLNKLTTGEVPELFSLKKNNNKTKPKLLGQIITETSE